MTMEMYLGLFFNFNVCEEERAKRKIHMDARIK